LLQKENPRCLTQRGLKGTHDSQAKSKGSV